MASSPANVSLSCGPVWRGPGASKDRDGTDRQLQGVRPLAEKFTLVNQHSEHSGKVLGFQDTIAESGGPRSVRRWPRRPCAIGHGPRAVSGRCGVPIREPECGAFGIAAQEFAPVIGAHLAP